MFVKLKNVQASKVRPEKVASSLKSHLKYLQYRERNPERESKKDRHFFNDHAINVDRRWVQQEMMGERAGDIYYHRIILSPASNEPVSDWRQWTRAIMRDLETRFGQELNWYAVHHQNTDNPHVHVVLQGTGKDRETGHIRPVTFNGQDFKYMRESGRAHSEYEHQQFLAEKMREFDERDTISKSTPQREQETNQQGDRSNEQEEVPDFSR